MWKYSLNEIKTSEFNYFIIVLVNLYSVSVNSSANWPIWKMIICYLYFISTGCAILKHYFEIKTFILKLLEIFFSSCLVTLLNDNFMSYFWYFFFSVIILPEGFGPCVIAQRVNGCRWVVLQVELKQLVLEAALA